MTPQTLSRTAGTQAPAPVSVWLRLLRCTTLIERELRARLRDEFDTTLPRFDLLAQLDAAVREGADGLTMTELSRRMMVTNGNLTSVVDRLVTEGLVSRTASPSDRRVQLIRLTTGGKRALDAMIPAHHAWVAELFAEFDPDDARLLHELLGRLRGSFRHTMPGEGAA